MKGDRANPTGLIFPGRDSGKAHQKNGINRVAPEIADKMGAGAAAAHGAARACFKTWGTEETTFQREVIECALAQILAERRRERRFPTVVEYRF
jgi:hypothetical protein